MLPPSIVGRGLQSLHISSTNTNTTNMHAVGRAIAPSPHQSLTGSFSQARSRLVSAKRRGCWLRSTNIWTAPQIMRRRTGCTYVDSLLTQIPRPTQLTDRPGSFPANPCPTTTTTPTSRRRPLAADGRGGVPGGPAGADDGCGERQQLPPAAAGPSHAGGRGAAGVGRQPLRLLRAVLAVV